MYDTHTTDAVILGMHMHGEADKDVMLATRDFGVVRARVSGARKLASKHRFHLVEGARVSATLIKGRMFWRLVGVRDSELGNNTHGARIVRAKLSLLVNRLVHGEVPDSVLFEQLMHGFTYMDDVRELSVYEALEHLLALRICHTLGYVGVDARIAPLLGESGVTPVAIAGAKVLQKDIAQIVNSALHASHL